RARLVGGGPTSRRSHLSADLLFGAGRSLVRVSLSSEFPDSSPDCREILRISRTFWAPLADNVLESHDYGARHAESGTGNCSPENRELDCAKQGTDRKIRRAPGSGTMNKIAWCIRGPFAAEDLPHFEYCRAERDSLFARAML